MECEEIVVQARQRNAGYKYIQCQEKRLTKLCRLLFSTQDFLLKMSNTMRQKWSYQLPELVISV